MRTLLVLLALAAPTDAGSIDAFAMAKRAYDVRDWETADALFRIAITSFPDDPGVVPAGLLWIDTLGALGRSGEVIDLANRLLDLRPNATGPSRKQLLAIRAREIGVAVRSMCSDGSVTPSELLRMISLPRSR